MGYKNFTMANAKAMSGQRRKTRSPKHPFHLKYAPFDIQPFFFAPVLPGETMKSAVVQSRLITAPVKNPIIGWWQEKWLFYIRLRDIRAIGTNDGEGADVVSEEVEKMLLNLQWNSSGLTGTGDAPAFYFDNTGINWLHYAYERIVQEYFRDGMEGLGQAGSQTFIKKARIRGNNAFDSLTKQSAMPQTVIDTDLADTSVQVLDEQYRTWEILRSQKLIEMDFSDYLAAHGIAPDANDEDKPELLRYWNDWSYPSNTINPADVLDSEGEVVVPAGQPTGAISMSMNGAATKDRFFREPGFLVGITCLRPKVYLKNQGAAVAHNLDSMLNWLPAMMRSDVSASLEKFIGGNGPLKSLLDTETTDDYWIDMRDLFVYGEQFLNFDPTTVTGYNEVSIPVDSSNNNASFYPDNTSIDGLFVQNDRLATVSEDGLVSLAILSHEANDAT